MDLRRANSSTSISLIWCVRDSKWLITYYAHLLHTAGSKLFFFSMKNPAGSNLSITTFFQYLYITYGNFSLESNDFCACFIFLLDYKQVNYTLTYFNSLKVSQYYLYCFIPSTHRTKCNSDAINIKLIDIMEYT